MAKDAAEIDRAIRAVYVAYLTHLDTGNADKIADEDLDVMRAVVKHSAVQNVLELARIVKRGEQNGR